MTTCQIQTLDGALLQSVQKAWEETAKISGAWLVCHPGCSQCCVGAFAIHSLDVYRLHSGLVELRLSDPARAARVEARAAAYIERNWNAFPGNPVTGVLGESAESKALFDDFANDEACPALDPEQKTCDLYRARPMTCRVFGPPVRNEDGLGVCELCFVGATSEQVAACEMVPDPDNLESAVIDELFGKNPTAPQTIVAYALQREVNAPFQVTRPF